MSGMPGMAGMAAAAATAATGAMVGSTPGTYSSQQYDHVTVTAGAMPYVPGAYDLTQQNHSQLPLQPTQG